MNPPTFTHSSNVCCVCKTNVVPAKPAFSRIMHKQIFLALLFFICFLSAAFAQQVVKQSNIPAGAAPPPSPGLTAPTTINFLQFTPANYGSQKHPLIIFLHGIGERENMPIEYPANSGTYHPAVVTDIARVFGTPPYNCANGASMNFEVNGQKSSFVLLSPQLSSVYGYWPKFYAEQMIAYAKANLNIDPNRIYLTGLSLGGGGVWRATTETGGWDYSFDPKIAAAAPICGTQEEIDANMCSTIAGSHLPVWAFHSMDDHTVAVGATQHAQILLGQCTGMDPAAKFTYYQSGDHPGAWTNAYDTGHINPPVVAGSSTAAITNLYEWFLSNTRASVPSCSNNILPTNGATLATSTTANLSWNASDYATSYDIYLWVGATAPSTRTYNTNGTNYALTGLTAGTSYKWFVVPRNAKGDAAGCSSNTTTFSTATGTLAPPSCVTNISPAGGTSLSTTTTATLSWNTAANASSYDVYVWTGATAPTSATANVTATSYNATGLTASTTYKWYVVPKNANGAATGCSSNQTTFTTANNATNQPPIANAGGNSSTSDNNFTLNGTASSDPDGTIVEWYWSQINGNTVTWGDGNHFGQTKNVSSLTPGTYTFQLQVKDNSGALSYSVMTLTVTNALSCVTNASPANGTTIATANTAMLKWNAATNATSYDVYLWTGNIAPSSPTANITTNYYNAMGLVASTVYNWYVVPHYSSGVATGCISNKTIFTTAVNSAPVANAGTGFTTTSGSVTLDGTGSTGSISEYYWYYNGSLTAPQWSNHFSATPTVSGLVQGTYVFELQVKGTGYSNSYSAVQVTVTGSGLRTNTSAEVFPANTTETAKGKLSLYPNPVHNSAVITLISADKGVKTIRLYNTTGVLKATYNWQTIKGSNIFSLKNIPGLSNGLYIIDIRESNGKAVGNLKFVKQ